MPPRRVPSCTDRRVFFAAGPPQGKKHPLGGQQAEGAAWGLFFCRRTAPRQKAPPWGAASRRRSVGAFFAWRRGVPKSANLSFDFIAVRAWRGLRVARPHPLSNHHGDRYMPYVNIKITREGATT